MNTDRLRAAKIAENASRPDSGSQSERSEGPDGEGKERGIPGGALARISQPDEVIEVSEEIVVFGESSDSGGGGVITLDPGMFDAFEAHIDILDQTRPHITRP